MACKIVIFVFGREMITSNHFAFTKEFSLSITNCPATVTPLASSRITSVLTVLVSVHAWVRLK